MKKPPRGKSLPRDDEKSGSEAFFGSAFSRNVDFIIQKFALSHSSTHKLLMDSEGPVRFGVYRSVEVVQKPISERFLMQFYSFSFAPSGSKCLKVDPQSAFFRVHQ
jgi:hypothetical protein